MIENRDAERAVLGSVLVGGLEQPLAKARAVIRGPGDFASAENRRVWVALCELADAGSPTDDPVILKTHLGGDANLIHDLYDAAMGADTKNVEHYAKLVRAAAERRNLRSAANRVIEALDDPKSEPIDLTAALEAVTSAIRPGALPVLDRLAAPYSLTEWRADLTALAEGTTTGVDALDETGIRWLPGKVYAVIGRPGHGKTAVMLELVARYLETHPDAHAVYLSWEEPLAELVVRLMLRADAKRCQSLGSRAGEVSFAPAPIFRQTVRDWGRGLPSGQAFSDRLEAAAADVAPLIDRLHLIDGDEMGHNAPVVLAGLAHWMRENGPPGLVAVDYFQKLRGGRGDQHFNRQNELQAVSDLLRRFAKGSPLTGDGDRFDGSYAVPVLVGAQVTRGKGEHPSGDGVREADDLLNDASGMIAVSKESNGGDERDESCAIRLSVPKNRDGRARPLDVAKLAWRPARCWFSDGALRDGERVRWSKIETEAPSEGKGKGNGKARGPDYLD